MVAMQTFTVVPQTDVRGCLAVGADTQSVSIVTMNSGGSCMVRALKFLPMILVVLAFGAFNPIMEVGPTKNVAFWNLPREPKYDATLIALWRMYARLHHRLIDYGYKHAQEATQTGMPIVRPLFLVDPQAPAAWENWWTYLYGADIVVSPVWEKGRREQQVYLPSGAKWRDAWRGKVYQGGQTVTVTAAPHQIPIFIREGAKIDLGDLNKEWAEAQAIAQKKPDLQALDAEARAWLEKNK